MTNADAIAADPHARRLRILLVEDYEVDARIVIELLDLVDEAERPSLTHVRSVGEAVEALGADPYDCVLLDLGLPDGEGVENIGRIRAAGSRTAIVVMTGLDDQQRAVDALRHGAQEYLVKGRLDHTALMRHLRHAIQRNSLVTELDQQRAHHQQRAGHDPLTGLMNRQLLAERVRAAIAQAAQRGDRLALCFLDLDGFKGINDRLGHAVGDAVLVEVARRLQSAIRAGDVVARLGGDEFVVLQNPVGTDAEILQTGMRLVEAVRELRQIESHPIRIGVSVGIAIYPDHGEGLEALLLHADEEMYAVKRKGGGGLGVRRIKGRHAAPPMPAADDDEAMLSQRGAALIYQPWLHDNGQTAGLEVLLRQRNGQVLLEPEALLHAFETLGPGNPLGRWLLRTTCAQWGRWREKGFRPGRLALNMSALEAGESGFPDDVAATLAHTGMSADALQIEIAEHLLDAPGRRLLDNLHALRQQGVRVVLDRFGRDIASLRKLVSLPIDGVKLDPSVVIGLDAEHGGYRALVTGVVHAARALGIDVVAVGVERESQARRCLQLGCRALQGSWLCAPVGAEQVPGALGDCAGRLQQLALHAGTPDLGLGT